MTAIQWTEQTWNPTTGCDRISPGCDNCYALTMAKRLKGMGSAKYQTDGDSRTSGPGFGITTHPDAYREPLRWKKPRKVFVNSMSDLFHAGITTADLHLIFGVMAATPQHTYQILTKRHGRMRSLLNDPLFAHMARHRAETVFGRNPEAAWTWPLPNVWLGVSVEDQKRADLRIPALIDTPAAVRFLSCEPLLGPVRFFDTDHSQHARDWDGDWICLDCSTDEQTVPWRTTGPARLGIDWVIIGGESGPGARPFQTAWATNLIEDSRAAGAAPFVKQLGTVWARDTYWAGKSVAAHGDTKGGDPTYWPANLRVREYPTTEAPRG
ncbi:phage Gp37/Gp68 family protein [Streptomyces californicus]|uniref:phage Gp37/Gp68 family protein n=1 Tax=Streptomyces californicus TaxID=67351 RepID=UPI003694A63B